MEIVSKNMGEKKENVSNTEQVVDKSMPTYDQLKNWCDQLLIQRNQLAERLNEITDIHNKLPWLFKVIENKEMFKEDFVGSCVEEITYILTPQEQPEESDNKKEDNKD